MSSSSRMWMHSSTSAVGCCKEEIWLGCTSEEVTSPEEGKVYAWNEFDTLLKASAWRINNNFDIVVEITKMAKENDWWHRNIFFNMGLWWSRSHFTDYFEAKLTRRSLLSDFDFKFQVNSNILKDEGQKNNIVHEYILVAIGCLSAAPEMQFGTPHRNTYEQANHDLSHSPKENKQKLREEKFLRAFAQSHPVHRTVWLIRCTAPSPVAHGRSDWTTRITRASLRLLIGLCGTATATSSLRLHNYTNSLSALSNSSRVIFLGHCNVFLAGSLNCCLDTVNPGMALYDIFCPLLSFCRASSNWYAFWTI